MGGIEIMNIRIPYLARTAFTLVSLAPRSSEASVVTLEASS